jgi:hypothetical protein
LQSSSEFIIHRSGLSTAAGLLLQSMKDYFPVVLKLQKAVAAVVRYLLR